MKTIFFLSILLLSPTFANANSCQVDCPYVIENRDQCRVLCLEEQNKMLIIQEQQEEEITPADQLEQQELRLNEIQNQLNNGLERFF